MSRSFLIICIKMFSYSIFNVESDSEIKNLIFCKILKFWIWIQNTDYRFLFYFDKNICDRVNPQLSKMLKISLIGPQNREICHFLRTLSLINAIFQVFASKFWKQLCNLSTKNKHISRFCRPIKEIFGILESWGFTLSHVFFSE